MNVVSGGSLTKFNEYSSLKKKLWTVISVDLLMAFKECEMWGYPSGVGDTSLGGVECAVVVSQYTCALSDWVLRRTAWSSLLLSLEADTALSDVILMSTMSWVTCEIQSLWAHAQTHPFYKKITRRRTTTKTHHHTSWATVGFSFAFQIYVSL